MQEDKYTRSRYQYILHMWIAPLIFLVGGCALVYILTGYFKLSELDRIFGIGFVFIIFLYQRFKMGIKWLKLSDDKYYYLGEIKDDDMGSNTVFVEPPFYEKEFSYAKNKQFINSVLGLVLTGISWSFFSKTQIIMPFIIFLGGLFFLLNSIKALRSGSVIKLAKEGIWTKDSAYLPWITIRKIAVTKTNVDDSVYHYLEFFLKSDDDDGPPAYKLQIDDLTDYEEIERIIATYKSN
jgi:hypothetical protein